MKAIEKQRPQLLISLGALLVALSAPTPTDAQVLLEACYTATGTVYLINQGTLGADCKTPQHVRFSWTDGAGADHGLLTGLSDDDHPEYVREGEAAGGDLDGTYPNPTVAKLQGSSVSSQSPSDGQVLAWDAGASAWEPMTPAMAGATDHGALTGLGDDDHSQYLLADTVRFATNGFAVAGLLGSGSIPDPGVNGVRLMWYPRKGAFRVGGDVVGAWADVNIGSYSMALGDNTQASGNNSTAFGTGTRASGGASVAMGYHSVASAGSSTAFGFETEASATYSTAMGRETTASGEASTAMGNQTVASALESTAMGMQSVAGGVRSIAAGYGSYATGDYSTAIGNTTVANGDGSTALGYNTTADGIAATAMGQVSKAEGEASTAMGSGTQATGDFSTAMGQSTLASGWGSVAMGWETSATKFLGFAMGERTTASGNHSTAMGVDTEASGNASLVMGQDSEASGPLSTAIGLLARASGSASTAIGDAVTASGIGAIAIGHDASTNGHSGSFAFGDRSRRSRFNVTANNSFAVMAQRVWFGAAGDQIATVGRYIETSTGAYLSDGGTWTNASSELLKQDFRDEDGETVLHAIRDLPIRSWSYRAEDPAVRHLGPTSQDFRAAFGLGDSDEAIATVDIDGLNLLAIQALERRTAELQAENELLRARLEALETVMRSESTPADRGTD